MEMALFAILAAGAALLVRLGMAMYQTGVVRAKNSAAVMIRNFSDICLGVIAFMCIGAAIVFSGAENGFLGINRTLLLHMPLPQLSGHVLMILGAVLLGGGIVTGVMAERSRF